ncbi:MAG: hypothetical protein VX127_09440 [Myxococcota bacterium]|nr:hypothetical protein [Myxococcota bacterium]
MWTAVTVRAAWTLMMNGIRVSPAVLCDARDHALLSLPSGVDVDEAEHRAGLLTLEYLARLSGKSVRRLDTETPDLDMVHEGWRRGLKASLDPTADTVLRLHYGDGMDLDAVESAAAVHRDGLESAKATLRRLVRTMAEAAGVPAQGWPDAKVDQLLTRLANTAEPGCPEPMDVLSEHNRPHVDACPRCSRAVRLIRGGVIAPSDLVAGADQAEAPHVAVAVLLLHPDSRRAQKKLAKVLGPGPTRVAPDAWLMSKAELDSAKAAIHRLVSDSIVPRHHLRGAVVNGRGRWTGSVLLGPVAVQAIEAARARPWAEIDTLGELPPPRPAPPSPARWWAGAGLLGLVAVAAGVSVLGPRETAPDVPIEASFLSVEDGWEITFDADDLAVIDVVSLTDKGPAIVHRNVGAGRGQWATGDGSYRVYVPDETVAILASQRGVPDLPDLIERVRSDPAPMQALEAHVRATNPTVAWVGSPAITELPDDLGDAVEPAAPPDQ